MTRTTKDWAMLALKVVMVSLFIGYLVLQYPAYPPFPEITSASVAYILNFLGESAIPYQNLLIVQGLPVMVVSAECSGIILMMIFPLTIFMIPSVPMIHRFGALLFMPLLFFGNIARLTIDTLVGLHYSADALIFFHDTAGQVILFFWAVFMYLIWLKVFGNFPKEKLAMFNSPLAQPIEEGEETPPQK